VSLNPEQESVFRERATYVDFLLVWATFRSLDDAILSLPGDGAQHPACDVTCITGWPFSPEWRAGISPDVITVGGVGIWRRGRGWVAVAPRVCGLFKHPAPDNEGGGPSG